VQSDRQSGLGLMGRHGASPAVVDGDILCYSVTLMVVDALGWIGRGLFRACKGKFKSNRGWQLGLHPLFRVGTCGSRSATEGGVSDSTMDGSPSTNRWRNRRGGQVYNLGETVLKFLSRQIGYYTGGGGEEGDSGEGSAHPKPPVRSINQCRTKRDIMMELGSDVGGSSSTVGFGTGYESQADKGVAQGIDKENLHEESKDWAVEVYKGSTKGKAQVEEQTDELEIKLDEEDAVETSKVLGIAVLYSRKSYNPQLLFSDMINTCSVQRLAAVEKLGDHMFKIEFARKEEKVHAIEGGPWRHKGDALLVAHYDGLLRPLKIRIQSIGLWVRLYDLSAAIMKPTMAQQLGG
jgi:hypothetical protein